MHVFARSGYRLNRTSIEIKLAYSGFLLLSLIGVGTMLALSAGRIGVSPSAIAAFYRGGEGEMSFPKELWQLMETAHFHAFSIPVVLLILSHLLFATGCPAPWRLVISATCYVGGFLEIVAPFAIRYVNQGYVYAFLLGWILLALGMCASIALSLAALWSPERERQELDEDDEDQST